MRSNRPHPRPGRSRLARWAIVPIGAAVTLFLAGCTQEQLQGFMPGDGPGITNQTDRVVALWVNSWIVLLGVGVVTWALIIWAAIAYRRRKGQTGLPVQLRYNLPIEIFYTIVPFILVLGFFAFTARDQAILEEPFAEEPDVVIEVYGKRWSWDFNYVKEDVYFAGIQAQERPDGNVDEDTIPTLYLPVDQKVEIHIESRDVIHSFWIVDFLYKKDMIPAKTNYWYFIPLKEGTYAGKCAELCGEYHAHMLFNLEVVSQAEYDAYIQSLRDAGNTGQLDSTYNLNQNLPGNGGSSEEGQE